MRSVCVCVSERVCLKSEKEAERMKEQWVGEQQICFSSFSDAGVFKLKQAKRVKSGN